MDRSRNLEMNVLNRISHELVRRRHVTELLSSVLDILYHEMGLLRGTVTLRQGDLLVIEASHGLTGAERERGKYKLGEGVTGKVAQTGESRIIPDISCSVEFLDRTRSRRREKNNNIAFICVPIIRDDEVVGTMSIDRRVTPQADLARDLNLLETVANLMGDAVLKLHEELEEHERLMDENRRLKQEIGTLRFVDIVGNCSSMRSVYAMVSQVAPSNATVLIRGSSGTGKELIARAIVASSRRADKPFVVVNCAALPENLVESELFGHEKGAFTGAVSRRAGRVEAAENGTLFLDEIGDIGLPVQVKLLRFLQERSYQRIGSNEEHHADVRVLAATSRDLEKLMKEGKFREDLYYRLNVFPIHLPDLCKRRSDIILLAEHFLDKYNRLYKRSIRRISTPAINMMMAYHWPGNVRELENCIERAVLTASGDVLHGYDLPPSLQTGEHTGTAKVSVGENAPFEALVNSFERELLVEALKLNGGNVAAASRQLGLTKRIAHYKIARLGITPDWYKK